MSLEFVQPDTLPEALEALAQDADQAKIIAGGTALVLMMQQKLIAPERLISLERIPDLNDIRAGEDGIHLGALTLLRDIERSEVVQEPLPALALACGEVGNVRIRNQATIGGNLAEADYASDPPAMLLALDASVTAASQGGTRAIPLTEFFLGFYTTALQPDELITDVFIPSVPPNTRMTYIKFKSRSSEDRPCVGIAAAAQFDGETCVQLRLAVGAATEIPTRLPSVEGLAQGHPLTDEVISEIAEGYASQIDTLNDLRGSSWYRTQMIRVHVKQALMEIRDDRR